MIKTTLVTETKLFQQHNQPLYNYFDEFSKIFNFLVRRSIHHLRRNLNGQKESEYRSQMMKDFNLSNRAAKAIIKTAKNRLSLINESNKYHYHALFRQRVKLNDKIKKLKIKIDKKNKHRDRVNHYLTESSKEMMRYIYKSCIDMKRLIKQGIRMALSVLIPTKASFL